MSGARYSEIWLFDFMAGKEPHVMCCQTMMLILLLRWLPPKSRAPCSKMWILSQVLSPKPPRLARPLKERRRRVGYTKNLRSITTWVLVRLVNMVVQIIMLVLALALAWRTSKSAQRSQLSVDQRLRLWLLGMLLILPLILLSLNELVSLFNSVAVSKISKPKEFIDLDQDIRFIIYGKASEEERVLELQWDGPLENPHLNTHYFYRPTAKARLLPTIIQINSEARWYLLQKKKAYQITNFASERQRRVDDSNWTPNLPVNQYFNPRADIPYLRPNTCMRVVVEFISDMKSRGIPFSKIAILCSGLLTNICHD